MNQHLIQRLSAIQSALLAQHQGGVGLPNAVVGSERETFLREFLQRVFPSHYRFSSGVITDCAGTLSGQIDIAVEYPFLPSFPMPGSNDRLVLAESVLAAIEVKSNLIAQWDQVEATTRAIKKLNRIMSPAMRTGAPPSPQIPCIAVGYHGHTTGKGLHDRLETTPLDCRPDAALVIESGCFEGYGMQWSGASGLLGLCVAFTILSSQMILANPHIHHYMR